MSSGARLRNLVVVGGLGGFAWYMLSPRSVFETTGSKQIGDRWSSAGGSTTHTPGAATPRGSESDVRNNQKDPSGIDTKKFQETQADQRPGKPGPFDEGWNKTHYGTSTGK